MKNMAALSLLILSFITGCSPSIDGVIPIDAKIEKLATGFKFTEGPVSDGVGNIYFTDIPNNRVHKWSPGAGASIFLENTNRANGLAFDAGGNLVMCSGGGRKLVSVDAKKNSTVLVSQYKGKKLNSPNDLWIDSKGGIYFTDPRYWKRDDMEMREHVYYLSPDRKKLTRVIDDHTRPNGIIGTPDGRKLYVADRGSKKTWVYDIGKDGLLSNKKLFAHVGSDGMTMDTEGNVYMTAENVVVYSRSGKMIEVIVVPETPTNVCFGSKGEKKLYITARKSLYAIKTHFGGCGRLTRSGE